MFVRSTAENRGEYRESCIIDASYNTYFEFGTGNLDKRPIMKTSRRGRPTGSWLDVNKRYGARVKS